MKRIDSDRRLGVNPPAPAHHYLLPVLLWAIIHGSLVLLFYWRALTRAAESLPPAMQGPLFAGYGIQAVALGLTGLLVTLPFLVLGRGYPVVSSIVIALLAAYLLVDSLVLETLGMHINGLVLEVALQSNGLVETGVPAVEVAALAGAVIGLAIADGWVGTLLIRRFATPRRPWKLVLVILALWTGERAVSAYQIFVGGQPAEAAVGLLPLQPRVRFNSLLTALTGRDPVRELDATLAPQVGTPASSIEPHEVELERSPDVLLVLIESLRADFLSPEIMPNLYRRSRHGTVFTRHYSAAASTQFALFGLLYGIDAQRRDAVIGAGRTPLLFPVLKRHGYECRFLTASTVDWMGLKQTVFRDVVAGLETDYRGNGTEKDAAMLASATRLAQDLEPDRPLFLFLFFAGTHYNYSYPERSAVFHPTWNGKGTLALAGQSPEHVRNRAMNAAREVDTKLEEFLLAYEAHRGRRPLLLITGDHGEEFGENGVFGHATNVSALQLHVPMVVFDERLAPGTNDSVTSHVDVVPTLLGLLGDQHDPALYGDGTRMYAAPPDRYVLSSVGWKQKFALIGATLKVVFHGEDAGFRGVRVTDPADRFLPDARDRFAREAPRLLRRLRSGVSPPTIADDG